MYSVERSELMKYIVLTYSSIETVYVICINLLCLPVPRVFENVNSGFYVHRVEAVDLDSQPRLKYSLDPLNSEARNEEGSIVKVRQSHTRASYKKINSSKLNN